MCPADGEKHDIRRVVVLKPFPVSLPLLTELPHFCFLSRCFAFFPTFLSTSLLCVFPLWYQSHRECAATLLRSNHSHCAKLLKSVDAHGTLLLRGTIFYSGDVGGATSVRHTTNHRFSTNVCSHHNLSLYSYYNVLLYHA